MKRAWRGAALILLASLAVSTAASARPAPSTPGQQGLAYVQALGLDPAAAIVQAGVRNYVGPACPGQGWTCAPDEGRPVVQVAQANGVNAFECTGSTGGGNNCVVFQNSPGGNIARCILSTDAPGVTQSCQITQISTTGNNSATVDMNISQSAGTNQSAAQIGRVIQRSETGFNSYSASQKIRETAESTSGVIQQVQAGSQLLETDQQATTSGANAATVAQSLTLHATSNGGTSVDQRQNADSVTEDQKVAVHQKSSTGTNNAGMDLKIDLQATANQSPADTQQVQGNEDGGQRVGLTQESAGVSTVSVIQEERQHAVANGDAPQFQFGPHICCDGANPIPVPGVGDSAPAASHRSAADVEQETNQDCNAANTYSILQKTAQSAGPDAEQDDLAHGYFTTCGTGRIDQVSRQNGTTNTNSCEGSSCDTRQSCENGVCDTDAPDTTIDSAPPANSSSPVAVFTFSADEPSTFECSLDGSSFESCTSPVTYTDLSDGEHSFAVRATDELGNTDPTPATYAWDIDTVAPETTINAAPPVQSSSPNATFGFTGSEPGVTFECSLDGGAFASCTSPTTYNGLADGAHAFGVRATDAAGNADPTPATYSWTIDTIAPDTTITAGPTGATQSTSATFEFTATEPGATFGCSLDGGAFTACTSPTTYTGLANGQHSFAVRATDVAGNTDQTPATRNWIVDNVQPVSDFDPNQDGQIYPGDPLIESFVTGSAVDAHSGVVQVAVTFTPRIGSPETRDATLTCGPGGTSCTWKVRVPSTPGIYDVTKRAHDAAGNIEPADEQITITVVP